MLKFLTILIGLMFPAVATAGQSPWSFYQSQEPSYSVRVAGAVTARAVNKTQGRKKNVRVTGGKNGLDIARRYIGTNPTGMRYLWCARFLNFAEKKAGRPGTGSDLAFSFRKYGKAVAGGVKNVKPGDIVVTKRKGGGHVGYATGKVIKGKVELASGNSRGKRGKRIVSVGLYPIKSVVAVRRVT